MDVEGPDRASRPRRLSGPAASRATPRPGPSARFGFAGIPPAWPECSAYRNAVRCFTEAEDDVPGILRTGGNILPYLDQAGVQAWTELGTASFERWFLLGWSRAAEAEEGG